MECEALATYIDITRVGINLLTNYGRNAMQADAAQLSFSDDSFDSVIASAEDLLKEDDGGHNVPERFEL